MIAGLVHQVVSLVLSIVFASDYARRCSMCGVAGVAQIRKTFRHDLANQDPPTAPHESNRIELLPDSIRFELISIITVRTDSN
jgi:hypothetical protein